MHDTIRLCVQAPCMYTLARARRHDRRHNRLEKITCLLRIATKKLEIIFKMTAQSLAQPTTRCLLEWHLSERSQTMRPKREKNACMQCRLLYSNLIL